MFEKELNEIKEILDIIKQEMNNAPEELKKKLGFHYVLITVALKIANWLMGVVIRIDQVLEGEEQKK